MLDKIAKYRELQLRWRACDRKTEKGAHAASLIREEMFDIAKGIDSRDTGTVEAFASLLDDRLVRLVAAYDLLGCVGVTGTLAYRSLKVVRTVLEEKAGREAMQYLRAHAAGDLAAAEKAKRSLCRTLEYMLPYLVHLVQGRRWEYWCDGITQSEVTVLAPATILLTGIAYYGLCGSDWIGPFESSLECDVSSLELHRYRISFGSRNADGELEQIPLTRSAEERQQIVAQRPKATADWWFTFSGDNQSSTG